MNRNEDFNSSSKQALLSVLGVAILIVAVVGISFAAFTYTRAGVRENVVTTGTIQMSYDEATNGINISNALPMSELDAVKATVVNNSGVATPDTGTSVSDNVFDFTVSTTITGNPTINYDIVAQKANAEDADCDSTAYANGAKVVAGTATEAEAADYAACSVVGDANIRLRLDKNTSANTFTINQTTGAEEATNASTVLAASPFTNSAATANNATGRGAMSDGMVLENGTVSTTVNWYYRLWMWVDSNYPVDGTARTYKVKVNVYGKI